MGWKDSRAGSTIEEIGFGLQTPLIQPPPNPAPKTSMRKGLGFREFRVEDLNP